MIIFEKTNKWQITPRIQFPFKSPFFSRWCNEMLSWEIQALEVTYSLMFQKKQSKFVLFLCETVRGCKASWRPSDEKSRPALASAHLLFYHWKHQFLPGDRRNTSRVISRTSLTATERELKGLFIWETWANQHREVLMRRLITMRWRGPSCTSVGKKWMNAEYEWDDFRLRVLPLQLSTVIYIFDANNRLTVRVD